MKPIKWSRFWLEKTKAESAEHRAQRLALIEEVQAWASANTVALDDDWKGFNRVLHQFGDRWRDAGHVGEKVFAELQPQWKAAISAAAAPLEAMQEVSLAARQAMIEESRQLAAQPELRIDAVKALQQRWQAQTHVVPLERRLEQKLWDAFRKPIDEAFERKTAQREQANAALGERDRIVLSAANALEAANAVGDAMAIRAAMAALEAALRGQAQAQAVLAAAEAPPAETVVPAVVAQEGASATPVEPVVPAPKPVVKPVRAMRGDDRPGMKRAEPAAPARGGRFGDRKEGSRDGARDAARGPRANPQGARADDRTARRDAGGERSLAPAAPRLGDAAFRAQRDALERAQLALRKLAAQAHGEALTQLLHAWEQRDAALLPATHDLGTRVSSAMRSAWSKSLSQAPAGDAGVALLRLEMAAELPTPAEYLNERRALQLQLLTKRHDPAPLQTWGQEVAAVLASQIDAGAARRLQSTLKVLLKT